MEKYTVLIGFTDEADVEAPAGTNVYWRGASYPREGHSPAPERLKYLQSNKTRYKKPVIAREKAGGKKHDSI